MDKNVQFAFRVDAPLREQFVRICKSIDRPAGQVLREFMREFAERHIQAPLFDDRREQTTFQAKNQADSS